MQMKTQLLKTLENSRNYSLAVAEAMPEELYESRPADTIWNFRELMNHIAYGIQWWQDNYIKQAETPWNPPPARSNKEQTIEWLRQVYAALENTLNKENLTEEKVQGFHATTDHITHHRGQAIVYLRYSGIEPPEYIY
jgi:uncharacterized damage-inducible protein DinB